MEEVTIYHVAPDGDEWTVKKENAERASFRSDKKEEALKRARELGQDDKTTVVIHRKDGTIEDVINPRG